MQAENSVLLRFMSSPPLCSSSADLVSNAGAKTKQRKGKKNKSLNSSMLDCSTLSEVIPGPEGTAEAGVCPWIPLGRGWFLP